MRLRDRIVGAATLLAMMPAAAATAAATGVADRQIAARWVVTWAGLPVFEAAITADISDGRYAARLTARGWVLAYSSPRPCLNVPALSSASATPRRPIPAR